MEYAYPEEAFLVGLLHDIGKLLMWTNFPQTYGFYKVALAAIENDETTAQIASRFGVHPRMVSTWIRQMLDGAADIFDKRQNQKLMMGLRMHL
jgi:HD-like signal output (HDOD) protein